MLTDYTNWLNKLSAGSVKSSLTSYLADDKISFSEAKSTLLSAATGGINTQEFADLKSLLQYPDAYDTVTGALLGYVLNGSPANAFWWNAAATIPGKPLPEPSSLGNLSAASTQASAIQLIDKWFTGSDVPQPIVGGDTARGEQPDILSYATFKGSLFNNGASAADVEQGQAGTCYYLASLGAIANANSQSIQSGFIQDNQDGSYSFRFYDINCNPVYVTTNNQLPIAGSSKTMALAHSPTDELWVALAEKAYAQLNTTSILPTSDTVNSYQAVEGGWAYPLKQITGANYTYFTGAAEFKEGTGDRFAYDTKYSSNYSTYQSEIIGLLQSGSAGWLASFVDTQNATGQTELVQGHAFMVNGYDAASDSLIVRNPWGGAETADYLPQFQLKLQDIWNKDVVLAVTNTALANKSFTYTIKSDADTKALAKAEGSNINIKISRDQTQDTAATIYYKVFQVSDTQAVDVQSNGLINAIDFSKYDKDFNLTIPVLTDGVKEGIESFRVEFYKSASGGAAFQTVNSFIKDTQDSTVSYLMKLSKTVIEGDAQTLYIEIDRDTLGKPAEVYLSIADPIGDNKKIFVPDIKTQLPVGGDSGFSNQSVSFLANESKVTVAVSVFNPDAVSGQVTINLYKNQQDDQVDSSLSFNLEVQASNSDQNTIYTLTTDAADENMAVAEGDDIHFILERSNADSVATVYLSTEGSAKKGEDYNSDFIHPVVFEVGQTSAQIKVRTCNDFWLENTETLQLNVSKTPLGDNLLASTTAYIKNSFVPLNIYTISCEASSSNPVKEGGSVFFTINREDASEKSSVYLDTFDGKAVSDQEDWSDDYQSIKSEELVFEVGETSKQVEVNTFLDKNKETVEDFFLGVKTYLANSDYNAISQAFIADPKKIPNFNYSVNNTTIVDGDSAEFLITRSGKTLATDSSTVYLYVSEGSATPGTDYVENIYDYPLTFLPGETSKTISLETLGFQEDDWLEEELYLDLYKYRSDELYTTYGTATLVRDHILYEGTDEDEFIEGSEDKEELDGQGGNDVLIGYGDQDILWGGAGNDIFYYTSINDSTPDYPDFIKDFGRGDKLDLSEIDADENLDGDQAFSKLEIKKDFDMESFSQVGQLVFDPNAQTLYGNVNEDPAADFAILMIGVSKLSVKDIVL